MSCIEHTLPRHGWIFNRHRILWRINSKLAGAQLWSAKKGVVSYCDSCNREWFAAFGFQKPGKADIMGMHLKRTTIAKMLRRQRVARNMQARKADINDSMNHGHASQKNNNCQDVTTAAG